MNEEATRITAPSGTVGAPPSQPPTAAPAAPAPLPGGAVIGPGVLVANTYLVERRLGGGGMGEVYLARHTSLGTLHAVKMIRAAMVEDQQVMDLFYREARVLRDVRHDAVVKYDGFVRDGEGREFLVMEYVDGTSLSERPPGMPVAPDDVLTLRERLCAGLAEAHRRGAVHRDLSPDNVILPGGRFAAAKLIDFGLCKLTDPSQETIIGDAFAGKYRFASPEQLGLYGGQVDARSDIYSLGLVLAAAALGRPLEMGASMAAAIASRQQPPDLSRVPPVLRDWLTAMLQPDPQHRPASIEALLGRWPAPTVPAAAGSARGAESVQHAGGRDAGPGRSAPAGRRLGTVAGLVLLGGAALGAGLYWVLRPLPAPLTATTGGSGTPSPIATTAPTAVTVTATPVATGPTPDIATPPQPTPAPLAPIVQPPPVTAGAESLKSAAPDTDAPSVTIALSAGVKTVLGAFQCPDLRASAAPGGALVVTGQVRSGEKANLYDQLSKAYPGRVDVTAVTTEPWPRCAVAPGMTAGIPPSAAGNAPRILLNQDQTVFRVGESLQMRVQSKAQQPGRISLAYVDSGGEVFHILPYAREPDAIPAGGSLAIAPLLAEPPVGSAVLVATWCSGALYRTAPPEKQAVVQFMNDFTAAREAGGADCATSLLDVEIRPR